MPRKKKKKIVQEDDYIPLSKKDIKSAVEIPVKQIKIEDLIKIEQKGKRKTKVGRLKSRKIDEEAEEQEEKLEEQRTGRTSIKGKYTLIITEKPQAALKISSALSDGKFRKLAENSVPYYEFTKNNKKIVVACAVGHLFTLKQQSGKGYPIFNIAWEPNYKVKKNDFSKKYYLLLSKLVKNADSFIVATDYDIEGEVIGWNIVRFIAKQKKAGRMKFSSLTKDELESAYQSLEEINWGQAYAGETRHFLDWMYGINLSRALMAAIKTTGGFRIMSIGRVQGPALHFIVDREKEIQKFKPTPYWQVFINIENILLKYVKDITKEKELDKFNGLKGREAECKTEKKEQKITPPAPFDLTSLQMESYKFFGLTPAKTLEVAQKLYLAGLISYPRTSSQKLPSSIGYGRIIKNLSKHFNETNFLTRKTPVEGGKSDPAHPAIYPTGEFDELSGDEKKVYELIAFRFLSCFASDALVENKTITALADGLKFNTKGMAIKEKGWMNIYKTKLQEKELPDINGLKKIKEVKIEKKMTQPPKRYSPASLVSELAKRNLGTKATRASIVETLYTRKYVDGKSITATPLGISLIDTLEKYSPIIIDEKLTREFEKEMNEILIAKKNLEEKEQKMLKKAEKTITSISDDLRKHEPKIGKELLKANEDLRKHEQEMNTIMPCPVCKKGVLRILYNRASRRYFLGCSSYPECRTTFSLPPNSLIKKAEKTCEKCSWPMLMAIKKSRRPWIFCFNPDCETNKEWREASREKYNNKMASEGLSGEKRKEENKD